MVCLLNLAFRCLKPEKKDRPFLDWICILLKKLMFIADEIYRWWYPDEIMLNNLWKIIVDKYNSSFDQSDSETSSDSLKEKFWFIDNSFFNSSGCLSFMCWFKLPSELCKIINTHTTYDNLPHGTCNVLQFRQLSSELSFFCRPYLRHSLQSLLPTISSIFNHS